MLPNERSKGGRLQNFRPRRLFSSRLQAVRVLVYVRAPSDGQSLPQNLRLPDERARQRTGRPPAHRARLRDDRRRSARPTWCCSTRAACAIRPSKRPSARWACSTHLHRDRPEVVFGFLGCMAQSRGASLLAEVPRARSRRGHAEIPPRGRLRGRGRRPPPRPAGGNLPPRRPAVVHRRCRGGGRFAGNDPRTRPAPRPAERVRVDHAGLQHALHVLHRARHARGRTLPRARRKSSPRSARSSPAG